MDMAGHFEVTRVIHPTLHENKGTAVHPVHFFSLIT